jgi:REP element-mobilizing transposase RayT
VGDGHELKGIMSYKTEHLASVDTYFHVYNRGVNHTSIFFHTYHYQNFLKRIQKASNQLQSVEVTAFCLMLNHFHFILHQLQANGLSQFIEKVCNGYVKSVNLELDRTGHLFEGKYKLKLIDDNSYLLHLSHYIHLNPVRAGLVSRAEDWHYSSCREYYGIVLEKLVHNELVMAQFDNEKEYREFVEEFKPEDQDRIKKFLF